MRLLCFDHGVGEIAHQILEPPLFDPFREERIWLPILTTTRRVAAQDLFLCSSCVIDPSSCCLISSNLIADNCTNRRTPSVVAAEIGVERPIGLGQFFARSLRTVLSRWQVDFVGHDDLRLLVQIRIEQLELPVNSPAIGPGDLSHRYSIHPANESTNSCRVTCRKNLSPNPWPSWAPSISPGISATTKLLPSP